MSNALKLIFQGNVDLYGRIEAVELHGTRCDLCGDPVFLVSVADPTDGGPRTVAGEVSWSVQGGGRPVVTRCRDCAREILTEMITVEPPDAEAAP